MKTKQTPASLPWYKQRPWALATAVVAVGLAYLLALRAIDTGSLQQYALFGLLVVVAITQLIRATRRPLKKDHGKK